MSEISEKGSSLLNRVEAKVRTTAFVKTNKAHKDEREAINELEDYIASLESQLAEAKARLAGYEEGYDFATKLPALGEEVLFKNFNGYFMLYKFDGVLMPSGVISLHDDYFNKHDYDISDTRFEYRWFPLPDAKGGEA